LMAKRLASSEFEESPSTKAKTTVIADDAASRAKAGAWRDFQDSDPLYALMGEANENKVIGPEGILKADLLQKYLKKAMIDKAAKKTKDWVEIWAAMGIPVEHQSVVLEPIVRFGLEHAPKGLGKILAELLKGHRVKTNAVCDAVQGAFKGLSDDYGVLREMLFIVFPKGPTSEWGWSRVGWSWQEWWKLANGTLTALNATSAFEELALLLDRIEAEGGQPLIKQPMIWNEKRLTSARELLCKLGSLEDEGDLVACLDASLK